MAYGKSGAPVRAFAFGTRPPVAGFPAAQESAKKRADLWTRLAGIEEVRREAKESLIESRMPPCEGKPKTCHRNGKERKEGDHLTLCDGCKEARKALFKLPEVIAQLDEDQKVARAAAKVACRDVKCYTWQEDDTLACWQVACTKIDPPKPSRYVPFEGTVALRWQTGLSVADAFAGTDLRMQLVSQPFPGPANPKATPRDPNSKRSKKRDWRLCRFRVGTDADRKPIWLELPVCLHRQLPKDGLIRKAHLRWWRVGSKIRWQLSLVVASEALSANDSQPIHPIAAAIDLCWRKMRDGGLRVAYLLDEMGRGGQLTLPPGWVKEWERTDRIKSHRDLLFNDARGALCAWKNTMELAAGFPNLGRVVVGATPMQPARLPDWFLEDTSHAVQWKSPRRLANLLRKWRDNRFPGDETVYRELAAWAKRDRHLWEYGDNLRDQLLANRKDLYRNWAVVVARNYATVVLEDFDLRQVAKVEKRTEEEGPNDLPPPARHQRVMVGPSIFRGAVVNALQREGRVVVKGDPKNTTVDCHRCGHHEEWDKAADLTHRCSNCGRTWDQDRNACANLLAGRGKEKKARAAA